MAHDDHMPDIQAAHRELQRRRGAVVAAALLVRRHQVGHVAHHEQVAGIAVGDNGRIDARVAAGDDHDPGRLTLADQLLERRAVAFVVVRAEALKAFDQFLDFIHGDFKYRVSQCWLTRSAIVNHSDP
ncbi:MAG TPA: hypothetical protein VLG93_00840 [Sulfuricaulis sp.]|nr:hypothetical protein [Sulfuricaulis sp.]